MRHIPIHMRHMHTCERRKFQCNLCGKAFRRMSTLSKHRAVHSSDRPYVCKLCQKTFKRATGLKSHRKTYSVLRPHQCHQEAFHEKDCIQQASACLQNMILYVFESKLMVMIRMRKQGMIVHSLFVKYDHA